MLTVYIAGPYTNGDCAANTGDAIRVFGRLAEMGVCPICPHTSMLIQMIAPQRWERWIDFGLEMVRRSDCVLRMAGESRGADIEVSEALALGIPVFRDNDQWLEFCDWVETQQRQEAESATGTDGVG